MRSNPTFKLEQPDYDFEYHCELCSTRPLSADDRNIAVRMIREWFESATAVPPFDLQRIRDGCMVLESEWAKIYVELYDDQTLVFHYKRLWYDSEIWRNCSRIKFGPDLQITWSQELKKEISQTLDLSVLRTNVKHFTVQVKRKICRSIRQLKIDPSCFIVRPVGGRRYRISDRGQMLATIKVLDPSLIEIQDVEIVPYFHSAPVWHL